MKFIARALGFVLVVLVVGFSIAAVAVSPLALKVAEDAFGVTEWTTLSSIGQAYGATSAILAGLGLLGVGVSLALQTRESKTNREQNLRTLHLELLRMSLDDPQYVECWGPFAGSDDPLLRKQHLYTNLIVSHWQMVYEIGYLKEVELRAILQGFFDGEIGRDFWESGREIRVETSSTMRAKRFHRVMDEEFRRSVGQGPPKSRRSITMPVPTDPSPTVCTMRKRSKAARIAAVLLE